MKSSGYQGSCSRPFEATCKDYEVLISLLSRFNSDFVSGTERSILFDRLLAGVMTHTESDYGFITESTETEGILKIHALRQSRNGDVSGIPWQPETSSQLEFPLLPGSVIDDLFHSGMPVISNRPFQDTRSLGTLPGNPMLRNFLAIPLSIRDKVSGLVAIGNRKGGFDRSLILHLAPLANGMAALIEADRHAERAYFDHLTGLPNEHVFLERFNAESSRHVRRRLPLSLLRLEIDHFNNYRNNHGIKTAETCVRRIAGTLIGNLRAEDCVVRVGPGQFAALLSDTPSFRAVVVAEKLRQAVVKSPIEIEGLETLMAPTLSIGLVTLPSGGRSYQAMMLVADKALQQAKADGGNQVSAGSMKNP
ncbi:MAG: sensor domain-containing diguanylate cyclase [Gammaproteobacteria bacterium]|nr:sensor domain-containing diguanylate cyclase [Gammaproteobacteria bacterium]MBU1655756.1 sensor domain-containing diguanylate cyclase [Gammaproteobacteria bacterium]MBU1959933.1 sensor domain-containing diguanylate cyclase [Gammaproteobacteria bacterium]